MESDPILPFESASDVLTREDPMSEKKARALGEYPK
jgi:hypothetical protein